MTEAFEIGVSLALQDGVSEAIGKARRDVAALEHAVRESGVSLRSLRDVGVRSASVAFGEPRRDLAAGPGKRMVTEAPARVEAEAEPRAGVERPLVARIEAGPRMDVAASPRLDMMAPPRMDGETGPRSEQEPEPRVVTQAAPRLLAETGLPGAKVGEVASQQRSDRAQEVTAPTLTVAARNTEPLKQALPEPRPATPDRLDGASMGAAVAAAWEPPQAAPDGLQQVTAPVAENAVGDTAAQAGVQAMGSAQIAAAPKAVSTAEPQAAFGALPLSAQTVASPMWGGTEAVNAAPLGNAAAVQRDDGQGLPGQMTLVNALHLSGGSAAAAQNTDQSAGIGYDVFAHGDGGPRTGDAQSVSAAAATVPRGAPAVGAAPASAREQGEPSHADLREAGPREGDVFLDGMLVGRWMSKFLNREAERASAGPTGFDARRGRLLPGVTVGG